MGKQAGSTNYLMAEVNRLLVLVEEHLSLGKDEWEPSANRPARRTCHIKQAKDLKRAVDDKANVVEMDDCGEDDSDADPEDDLEEEKRPVEPDFSFYYEPDDSFFND
ncbi:hypothetical protein PPTG_24725 [Phytophthora nicotianae INRA-310]|uniref:Uncharacterized protein n=1 Tax=Phytophthora nicotianae (strain INRA-310) TaxID=761204 RepID=W2PB94_PHYN3|nr:hypothetical protein PPTG_24725 [Phytophthora nicotianae INRA-310]ETM98101.1 hypothetical protein PPTG_24725 [Phytophthora nicotianae INRA-310]